MKIAFDVDGVVLNSIEVILEHIGEITGRRIRIDELGTWDLEVLGIDVKTLWRAVEWMYKAPVIAAYEGATRALSRIHRETREPLLFITGRSDPQTAQRQLQALNWNPTVPKMVVTGGDRNKTQYLADHLVEFMVEDDVKHVQEYLDAGIRVGLMHRPWNRDYSQAVTERFASWEELEAWYFDHLR